MSQFEQQQNEQQIAAAENAPNAQQQIPNNAGQLDLRRLGSFDHCWKMVAQKITDAAFWLGAELFLSVSAPLGGHQSVRETLAQHIRHLFGVFLRWEDILLVPNEHCALEAFAHGFCSSGDVVLCPTPFADPELPTTFSARTSVELRPIDMGERGAELELADLERAKQEIEREGRRVRALLLHNPHPLLGSIRGGDRRLAKILEWTSERDIYLLVDESLAAFDLWEFSSCLSLDHHGQFGQKLVWIWSAAQHLSLPGLEFAAIFVPRPDRLHPFLQTHPCAPLVQFLTAKLLEDFDWASELFARRKSRLDELRRLTIEGLAEMGVAEMARVRDAGIQWILADFNKYLLPNANADWEKALREEFAQSGRILLNSGHQLRMKEFGWFRLRVGQSELEVQEVLNRLKFVLEGKPKRSTEGGDELEDRIDLSKYGGKEIAWEKPLDEQSQIVEEELAEGEIIEEEEEEEENFQENALEANERDWAAALPSTSSQVSAQFTYEDFRRLSMIREEEGEDDILKHVFYAEEKKIVGNVGEMEEEGDAVMREVFAIFPAERLRWKQPLVEEKSISVESSTAQTVKEGGGDERPKEELKEEIEDLPQIVEEYDYGRKMKKLQGEEEEDVRNGLDAEMIGVGRRQKDEYKPKWPTTLTDFSFIEELVRSSEMEVASKIEQGEFYDEASTEEEEKEEGKKMEEEEEYFQSLTINVPIRVDKQQQIEAEEEEGTFEESSDSRRIIEIIDQIFHDAVQIRDFSSSSSDSHPNQAITTIRQEHWSRSDSGLAGDSPPDLSFSPLTDFEGHQLDRIEERAEYSPMESPEPTRHEQMLIEAFQEGPLQTSTLARDALVKSKEEEERHLGPTAQMLDDSGIFVEMPPGSLSIDFPLLIPVEHLRKGGKEGGIEEEMLEKEESEGMTVDLQFKTLVSTDEGDRNWVEDLVLMEHDHQEIGGTMGRTMVEIRDNLAENGGAKIGWEPLENLMESAATSVEPGAHRIRMDSEELAEQRREAEEQQQMAQAELAAMLSEGSAFCPTPASPTEKRVAFAQSGDGVPVWKPLDQMEFVVEEANGQKQLPKAMNDEQGGRKFSDALDELEEAEMLQRSRHGTFASDDYYKSSLVEEPVNVSRIEVDGEGGGAGRKWSKDPMDVVAEWNAARMAKKQEEMRGDGELAEVKLSIGEPVVWEARSQVILPAIEIERTERKIETWEAATNDDNASSSKVEEVREENGQMVKTIVQLGGKLPKKPPRTTLMKQLGEYEEKQQRSAYMEMTDSKQFSTAENVPPSESPPIDVPGRSQTNQVHHCMQMRRRESSRTKKRRTKSKDRFVLEHLNITEVDYLGGMSERVERGERLVTSISTRINRFSPDEFFRRLPYEENLVDLEREKMNKFVEMRRKRRSQSVPSRLDEGMEGDGEIGRIETETVTIRRLDREEELEDAKAKNELHCALERQQEEGDDGIGGRESGKQVFVTCRNPEHNEREDHCDPKRMYRVRRSTMMSENGYKRMKREHERRSQENPPELHSKFETIHYEIEPNRVEQQERPEIVRRATAKHKYRRPRRPRSPARIMVTTTRGGGFTIPGESIDRVTVRHTPGSNWVVSSIYRTTEYGWERTALKSGGGLEMGRS